MILRILLLFIIIAIIGNADSRTIQRTTDVVDVGLHQPLDDDHGTNTNNNIFWKQEGENYPNYCSAPQTMEQKRNIPPLDNDDVGLHMNLLHVTAFIRHGSRTPYTDYNCWEGYLEDLKQSQWNCSLTSYMSPGRGHYGGILLFEKVFDGLQYPLANALHGTCLEGQLLTTGYDQEYTNGRILRQTYIEGTDQRIRLFNSTDFNERPYEESVHFRSDNEQRTLISGQALLNGMFDVKNNTVMKLHTADYDMDILNHNEYICPRLKTIKEEAHNSEGYTMINKTFPALDVIPHLIDLKVPKWRYALDCVMTQYCNDRIIPKIFDDFHSDSDGSMFSKLVDFQTKSMTYHVTYNDAAYAKLAMGPLWSITRDLFDQVRSSSSFGDMMKNNVPRFALFSAHDTTLLELLASLGGDVWDEEWPAYASMLLVELYIDSSSTPRTYFRLLYNGKVITSKIEGCEKSLCDLDVLLNVIKPFATWNRDCTAPQTNGKGRKRNNHLTGIEVLDFLIVAIACSLLSTAGTYKYMKQRYRRKWLRDRRLEMSSLQLHEDRASMIPQVV